MIYFCSVDCSDFSTNGNGTLSLLSAEVMETLNGEYELMLVTPLIKLENGSGWWRTTFSMHLCLTP